MDRKRGERGSAIEIYTVATMEMEKFVIEANVTIRFAR